MAKPSKTPTAKTVSVPVSAPVPKSTPPSQVTPKCSDNTCKPDSKDCAKDKKPVKK